MQLNNENINLFWYYIGERYKIFQKRKAGKEGPWTEDPILRKWKFTNVFRYDDPGTIYVIDKIIKKNKQQTNNMDDDYVGKTILFNIIAYRLFNKIETSEKLGILPYRFYNVQETEQKVRELAKDMPVFTNAFVVSSLNCKKVFSEEFLKDADKIKRACLLLKFISKMVIEMWPIIWSKKNSQTTYEKILELPGIGPFLAYQICVDLGYWNKDLYNEDEHVVAGPGCIAGLKYLFTSFRDSNTGEKISHEQCIKYLCNNQPDGIELGGKKLNIMAIENCLCEISKYLKLYNKQGRARVKFVPKS